MRCAAGSDEADAAAAFVVVVFTVHRSPLVVRTWLGHSVVVRRAPALDISVAVFPHSHAQTYVPRTHVFAAAAAFVLQHKAQRLRSRTYGIARAHVSSARGAHRCYVVMRFESTSRRRGRIFHTHRTTTLPRHFFTLLSVHIFSLSHHCNVTK